MKVMPRKLFPQDGQLPEDVLGELVNMMFTALAPVVVMGVATVGMAALFATLGEGPAFPLLAVACFFMASLRVGIILAYRRRLAGPPLASAEIRLWESRYAWSSYSFAVMLGLLNILALLGDEVLAHMLVVGLTFGYGAGLATRTAVRPAICTISLLLVVLPTIAGLMTKVDDLGAHGAVIYLSQALLLAAFTIAGLETVAYLYRTTLQHLVTQRDLIRLARQDMLTGLPNRLLLQDRFKADIMELQRSGHLVALLVLDLDRFKAANDQFGHLAGDALLQAVAKRLRNTVAEQDTVARIGGDEFVVLQTGIRHEDEARRLAHRIIRVVSAPYQINQNKVQIGVSIGIAIAPRDGLELKKLASCADAALYIAKRQGRGRVMLWAEPLEGTMPVAV
jgi:diguanylate cyclase (GGDEF)-like protein